MANSNLKYLIAGTGGVGGSIAAFLHYPAKTSLALHVANTLPPYAKTDCNCTRFER